MILILQYDHLPGSRAIASVTSASHKLSLSLSLSRENNKKRKPGKAKVLLSYMCKYSESFITHLSNIFTLLLAGPIVPR
jgi:hypothetical protein